MAASELLACSNLLSHCEVCMIREVIRILRIWPALIVLMTFTSCGQGAYGRRLPLDVAYEFHEFLRDRIPPEYGVSIGGFQSSARKRPGVKLASELGDLGTWIIWLPADEYSVLHEIIVKIKLGRGTTSEGDDLPVIRQWKTFDVAIVWRAMDERADIVLEALKEG